MRYLLVISVYLYIMSTVINSQPAITGTVEMIETQHSLPRVLLIGDSVTKDYAEQVRERLKNKATVYLAPHGGHTDYGLAHLEKWLGEEHWDVIQINWGLEDIFEHEPVQNPTGQWGEEGGIQTLWMEYEDNLRDIAEILKDQKTRIIWATTTPVPENAPNRNPRNVRRYNEIASDIMREFGIYINDLYSATYPMLDKIQKPASPYFTEHGNGFISKYVADFIHELIQPALQVQFPTDVMTILDTDLGPWLDIDDWFDALIYSTIPSIQQGGIIMEHYATDWEETALINLLTMIDRPDIKMARGCQNPLERNKNGQIVASQYQDGTELILDTMKSSPKKVRVLCVGALTNVALAFIRNPELFMEKIQSVWFVGGMFGGYEHAHSKGRWDTNVHRDQIAADIIFNHPIPLVWFPVSLEMVVKSTGEQEETIRQVDHPAIQWLVDGIEYWRSRRGRAWAERTQQKRGEGRRVWSIFAHIAAAGLHPDWMAFRRGWAGFEPKEKWTWFQPDPSGPTLVLVKRDEKAIANWYTEHLKTLAKKE